MIKGLVVAALTGALLAAAGCSGGSGTAAPPAADAGMASVPVTITSAGGHHVFAVEIAKTPTQQEKGLMFRTGIKPDTGMLFWPYPATGGGPQVASFWMKNTPTPLDIVFIRANGTIAHIAENTVPFSETPVQSGEPVAAVLEIVGGRSADLGIAEGDKVSWPGKG